MSKRQKQNQIQGNWFNHEPVSRTEEELDRAFWQALAFVYPVGSLKPDGCAIHFRVWDTVGEDIRRRLIETAGDYPLWVITDEEEIAAFHSKVRHIGDIDTRGNGWAGIKLSLLQ